MMKSKPSPFAKEKEKEKPHGGAASSQLEGQSVAIIQDRDPTDQEIGSS